MVVEDIYGEVLRIERQAEAPMRVREIFENFEPYGWETPTHEIASRFGLRLEQVVRLDTNTSPFLPTSELRSLTHDLESDKVRVNDYPDTSYLELREGLSRYTGLSVDRFVITNGADEALDIVTKVLLDAGDEVLVPTPTYSMYRIVAQIMGATVRPVRRTAKGFALDIENILSAVNPLRTKIIFLCNPNNPTANFSPVEQVERLARESVGAVIVVDEAYFEFCGKSAVELTETYENLIVCRTFSKAFSMAGVRVGYIVAKKETVDRLNIVRPPNSLSVISLLLAQRAIADLGEMQRNVSATVSERNRMLQALGSIRGIEPYPSETNFVLFRLDADKDADLVHTRLMEKGLVLRNLSRVQGVENCLRTTVGTPEVNDRLISELERLLRA